MTTLRKSQPSKWDRRRERRDRRSRDYWAQRRAGAADPVALSAVAWDELRNLLRRAEHDALKRVQRAAPGEEGAALRQRDRAVAHVAHVCERLNRHLDAMIEETRSLR